MTENQNENQAISPKIVPITCPVCGSKNLVFVTEYHKAFGLKIVEIILVAFFLAYFVIATIPELIRGSFAPDLIIILLPILMISFRIMIVCIENRTHVKVICKDCGNIWLLD